MGLRINTNVGALNASRTLNRSSQSLKTSLERLSSGLRINRAKDDAAGLVIAEGLNKQVRGQAMAQRNAQDGISLVQTAEGALSETSNILQRMRELTVQAMSDTQDGGGRDAIKLELDQLSAQIDSIANDTEFNGATLLDNTDDIVLQVGFQAGQDLTVAGQDATADTLGVASGSLIVTDNTTSTTTLDAIDDAIDTVNTARATFGAAQNRLEFTINTLAIQEENAAAAESAIRDADIARESATFTRNQILVSAGTSVLAQANVLPQTALQLLG